MKFAHVDHVGPVSVIGLGYADYGTTVAYEESVRRTEEYVAGGGNYLDTAHCYAEWIEGHGGVSETTLGKIVRELGVRDRVVIATKGGHMPFMTYARPDLYLAPEVVGADLQQSLDRLQMDSVDLYYLHRDDPRVPVDEIIDFLEYQVNQRRIRAYAASNWSFARLREARLYAQSRGFRGFVALQQQWSLASPPWKEQPQDPTVRSLTVAQAHECTELALTPIVYSATANGYFGRGPEGHGFDSAENRAIYERAAELGKELGATANQVALAWLHSQPTPTVAVIGAKSAASLADALASADRVLTDTQRDFLRAD